MSVIKGVAISVIAIAVLILLAFGLELLGVYQFRFFEPKREAARREVFEETKSYNQGMIQELQNMQFDYYKADSSQKDALASIILHRAADYDEAKLPNDLRAFISKLKQDQR
jgi:hypothetical protein